LNCRSAKKWGIGGQAARILAVEREYDLFEKVDGHSIWRSSVHGHENAVRALKELAEQTKNEVRAMHLLTNSVMATMNTGH